jgi:hypothetical protein
MQWNDIDKPHDAPFFADGSPALNQLEAMVDAVGIRNVLYALAKVCDLKAEQNAHAWQDPAHAKTWAAWSVRIEACAAFKRISLR